MNLFQRVADLFVEKRMNHSELYQLISAGNPTHAGPPVNEGNAMRSSAVYACIRIISESIASLPLVLYQEDGRNKNRATNHPLYPILHDLANPLMTSLEWRELMMSHVLLRGNAYSEIDYTGTGQVKALWPLNPVHMQDIELSPQRKITYVYRLPDGETRRIPGYRIHHLKGLGNGIAGYSPIMQVARQAVGLSLAAEELGSRLFSNGARPGLILRHPGKLSEQAAERLKASFASEHQGLSNAHRTKILEEGMEIDTIGFTAEEAQFLETRKFQVTEIARIYRVPPHMLADLDRATFSNIEHQSLSFVVHTLMPWLVRHEQAIYRDLLSEQERRNHFAKYIVAGLVRGDISTRFQAYATGVTTGIMTRNEARELEDWNSIEGLDEPLLPLNMMEANAEPPEPTLAERLATRSLPDAETRATQVGRERQRIMQRTIRLFEDAASRVVKRETGEIRKAAKSKLGKRDVASFQSWLEGFYEQLREWFPDYFRNIMLTYAESIMASVASELDGEPAELNDELREWVERYLENYTEVYAVGGERQLRALLAESEGDENAEQLINERMDGWEETKAEKEGMGQAFEAGNALAIYAYGVAGVSFLRWVVNAGACPLCQKLNGRRIPISGSFANEGDTIEAEGVSPLPIVRKIRHGPIHQGCRCSVVAG